MGAPDGWIPTVTPFPRNDKEKWNIPLANRGVGVPPFCHCEEQQRLRRGNLAERTAPDGWIPTVTVFPRNDKEEMDCCTLYLRQFTSFPFQEVFRLRFTPLNMTRGGGV